MRALLKEGPWRDRSGRLSALRLATLALLIYPAAWMAFWWRSGRWLVPQGDLTYWSGAWAIAVLLASLAVSPLRRLLGWDRLGEVRRMVGVAALLYTVLHLAFFAWLQFWDWTAILTETATRPSLILAAFSLAGLMALGVTSFDGAVRAMGGPAWRRLHALTHVVAALAVAHFLLSPGSYGGLPYLALGAYLWLMGWRWLDRRERGRSIAALAALGAVAALATVAAEAALPALLLGMDARSALALNFSLELGLSPAWKVLALSLALALAPLLGRVPLGAA